MSWTWEKHPPIGWIVIGAILIFGFILAQIDDAPAAPGNRAPYNVPDSGGGAITTDSGGTGGVEYPYDPGMDTGYENPAPGDDGSYDCPPGGGPVWVGDNDPAGLDGNGDGWGCE